MNIHLLHVNDVHSQIENHMRLGALLRNLRSALATRGEWVLTFDIGDTIDRVRPESEATLGAINAELLGALGVDGWVFGNNEGLTVPVDGWPHLADRARTVVYGTNLRQASGAPFPGFADTHVYERAGVKIGVFGVTPNYERPYGVLQVQALEPFPAAEAAVASLRDRGCDIVVALSHLGLFADRALAQQVAGIDVILGGHTHQFMQAAERVGQTAIFQAGKHAFAFGHTTVNYDPVHRRIVSVHSESLPVDVHGVFDEAMLSAYQAFLPEVETSLSAPIVTLREPLITRFDEESDFANLLVDALFTKYSCDLGLMMAGALNASLLSGDVSMLHVHGACSTPTRPVILSLRGSDLEQVIADSLNPKSYHRPGFGFGFRGAVVGFLALAGATVCWVRDADGGRRLVSLSVGGEAVEPERWYRVVTCEYLLLSLVFPQFRNAKDIEFEPPLVREVLRDAIRREDLIASSRQRRYLECKSEPGTGQVRGKGDTME